MNDKIIDILTERPNKFTLNGKFYYLYPPTMGIMLLQSRIMPNLSLSGKDNATLEILRLIKRDRTAVCRVIALRACSSKKEALDALLLSRRAAAISRASDKEIATLFILCIDDDAEVIRAYKKETGIDRENKYYEKACRAQKGGGSYTFFGKTLYGSFISHFCEKYGWTLDYLLWGISYSNLCLLAADEVRSVYLSDEERKQAHIPQDREVINADDPDNYERIKQELGI